MFKFDSIPDVNGFRIIEVHYTEIRGFSGPDLHSHYAVAFDNEQQKWVKYHGDMDKIVPFLSQSREVIYSALSKYKTHIVSDYFHSTKSSNEITEFCDRYDMRWLEMAQSRIGHGWSKDWKPLT